MSISVTPLLRACPAKDCRVSIEQTEEQCRHEHDCGKATPCPLAAEFGQDHFRRALKALAPDITEGWADSPSRAS
jgi:hypothetical protein